MFALFAEIENKNPPEIQQFNLNRCLLKLLQQSWLNGTGLQFLMVFHIREIIFEKKN